VQEEFVEVSEKWESLSESFRELEESNQKMCEETFEREDRASKKLNEQRATIAQLEKKVQSSDNALKDAARASTEAQERTERLLQRAKEYDKATVTLLNAALARQGVDEARREWDSKKLALKEWDTVPKKKGRKKQS